MIKIPISKIKVTKPTISVSSCILAFYEIIFTHNTFIWTHCKVQYSIKSHWCSIWKLRCPVNQSLKKDFSISQVAFIWSLIHGSAVSRSMSIGMWFDWLTHVNQWLSSTLQIKYLMLRRSELELASLIFFIIFAYLIFMVIRICLCAKNYTSPWL